MDIVKVLKAKLQSAQNPSAQKLIELMLKKRSNLVLSADLLQKEPLFELIEEVGSEICMLKTHIDMLENFTPDVIERLQQYAEDFEFLLFEDRKFADIGNTVLQQFSAGVYRISEWADLVTIHVISGPGILEGLKKVASARGNGVFIVAEMSSKDNLCDEVYQAHCVSWAEQHRDLVAGFIAQHALTDDPGFLHLTPGVSLASQADNLDQQYRMPQQAVKEQGCDVIIVGRGITGSDNPHTVAAQYRNAAWVS